MPPKTAAPANQSPQLPAPSAEAQHVLDACLDYTGRRTSGLAIMLHGPWGCGKTWFIKNRLLPILISAKKRCLYISVNGLVSEEALDAEVVRAISEMQVASESGKNLLSLARENAKGALDFLGEAVPGAWGTAIKATANILGTRVATKKIIELVVKEGVVLVFDDIERHGMEDEQELLGYINQFTEHRRAHVFLGCDPDRMPENSDAKRFEKICGVRLSIQPELEAYVPFILAGESVGPTRTFIELFHGELVGIIKNLERPNLRRLGLALYHFRTIDSVVVTVLDELGQDGKGLREYVFRHVLYGVLESGDGRSCAKVFAKLLSPILLALSRSEGTSTDASAAAERYIPGGASELEESDLTTLSDVVDRGVVDKPAIGRMVRRLTRHSETPLDALHVTLTTSAFLGLEDLELDQQIDQAVKEMEAGHVTSPQQFTQWVSCITDLSEGGYTIHSTASLTRRFKRAVGKTTFVIFDNESRRIEVYHSRNGNRDEVEVINKLVMDRMEELQREHLQEQSRQLWASGVISFLKHLGTDQQGPHYSGPLLATISPSFFWDAVWQLTNQEREEVYSCLSFRLSNVEAQYDIHPLEHDWIQKSCKLLAKKSASNNCGISAQMIKRLLRLFRRERRTRAGAAPRKSHTPPSGPKRRAKGVDARRPTDGIA